MSDYLEPPKRYDRADEDVQTKTKKHRSRKRRATESGNVIKPEKSFAGLRKADFFVTGGFDIPLLALTMALLSIGLVMLFSSSYPTSYFKYGTSYHYFIRQLVFAVAGVAVMLFVSKINYKIVKAFVPALLVVSLILLVVVLFYHTNVETKAGEEFKRFIRIPGTSFTFQPSDIAKFTIVVTLASYMTKYSSYMNTFRYGIMYPAIITGSFCILIYMENHMSGTVLVFLIGLTMMFAGGAANGKWNRALFIGGLIIVVAAILVAMMFPSVLPDYVNDRLVAWRDKSFEPRGARWQTNNSLYAIGSGSFLGVGLGNSKQKYLYVSEPQNDFIFSIVCEELGFFGATVIILLFAALIIRTFIIALRTTDRFASLTAIGIATQIGVQTGLNILVVTDTIPNTGIALPFFSYGGTALLMLLFEMGIVLSISRKSNQKKV